MKNITELLKKCEITVDQLVNIINHEGGRDPTKPIIFVEECRNCQGTFFSVSQDHHMRINNGYPVHCPICREADRRNSKLNSFHKRKQRK